MGHEYVKENDVFSTDQNGVVPKPTASDIENNHVLKADHTWGEGGGSGEVVDVKVNGDSVLDENNEAQITSYKEVTMSEYNALPQSKETDGVLYCIKDAGGADAFPPLIFSDEEREIGVWRDGRPLYAKTYKDVPTTSQSWSAIITPPSGAIVVNLVGYVETFDSNSSLIARWPVESSWGSNGYFLTYIQSNNAIACYWRYDSASSAKLTATLYYTKSTDTPGSGIWNQQGSYAHHYSTTEHIVGTWIDGKPLYEKTAHGTFGNNETSLLIFIANNMEALTDLRGFLIPSDAPANRVSIETKSSLVWFDDLRTQDGKCVIKRGNGGYFGNTPEIYVTVCYTKTTD